MQRSNNIFKNECKHFKLDLNQHRICKLQRNKMKKQQFEIKQIRNVFYFPFSHFFSGLLKTGRLLFSNSLQVGGNSLVYRFGKFLVGRDGDNSRRWGRTIDRVFWLSGGAVGGGCGVWVLQRVCHTVFVTRLAIYSVLLWDNTNIGVILCMETNQ